MLPLTFLVYSMGSAGGGGALNATKCCIACGIDNGDSSGLSPTHLQEVQCRRFAEMPPEVRLSSAPNNEILGAMIFCMHFRSM